MPKTCNHIDIVQDCNFLIEEILTKSKQTETYQNTKVNKPNRKYLKIFREFTYKQNSQKL